MLVSCSEPGPPITGCVGHKEKDEDDDKDGAKNAGTPWGYCFVLQVWGNRRCRRYVVRTRVPDLQAAGPFDGRSARPVWRRRLRLLLLRRGWDGGSVLLGQAGVVYWQPAQATALGAGGRGVKLGATPLTALAPSGLAALGAPHDAWPLQARLPALQARFP